MKSSPSDLAVAQLFPGNSSSSSVGQPSVDASFKLTANLTAAQKQRIIDEERERLELFITQARTDALHTPASPLGRSTSDGDLLELFGSFDSAVPSAKTAGGQAYQQSTARQTASSTTPTIFTGFDDLFGLPAQQPICLSSNPYGKSMPIILPF